MSKSLVKTSSASLPAVERLGSMIAKIERDLAVRPSESEAIDAAEVLLKSWRNPRVEDDDIFPSQLAILFQAYPASSVRELCHPVLGLPGKKDWVPNIAECKGFLDQSVLAKNRRLTYADAELKALRGESTWQQDPRPSREEREAQLARHGFSPIRSHLPKAHRSSA